jgi:hypothetical protein
MKKSIKMQRKTSDSGRVETGEPGEERNIWRRKR